MGVLLRNYMMERFLERITVSEYSEKFILKDGMLVTSMVGLEARSTMDTRMCDFYDVHILLGLYRKEISPELLAHALTATAHKRGSENLMENAEKVLNNLHDSEAMGELWNNYQSKFSYAKDISWNIALRSVQQLAIAAGLSVISSP